MTEQMEQENRADGAVGFIEGPTDTVPEPTLFNVPLSLADALRITAAIGIVYTIVKHEAALDVARYANFVLDDDLGALFQPNAAVALGDEVDIEISPATQAFAAGELKKLGLRLIDIFDPPVPMVVAA